MRLPQSILRYLSVQTFHFLTIGVAITLLGILPVSAAAAARQLACTPASLDFGAVLIGQTQTLLVGVTNQGQTSVTISAIAAGDAEFTTSNLTLPLVLSAGQSVDLSVTFTPTATGWTYGTISFSSNASNETLALAVSGAGSRSEWGTSSPSSVSFGQVVMGTGSTVPIVLTNSRSSNLTMSKLGTSGSGFSVNGPAVPLTLEPGQTVTVNVTFAPQAAGTDGGSLFAYGLGLAVPLSGTGVAAAQYSVNLLWNSSSGATGYNIYRSTTASGTYSRLNSALDANTAYTDSTVVPGQTYYYSATSVSSSGVESALATPPVQAVIP
ncbi:MAG: choice-of-anchor D domain-containing protein [Candidatus Sulfotelmatobacter sp.]